MQKKILFADNTHQFSQEILSDVRTQQYQLTISETGQDCLQQLQNIRPDLCIVELMLPQIHGIEILQKAKQLLPNSGFILTCFHGMVQNYRCAAQMGANYFLEKPYTMDQLFALIESFFQGTLQLNPFQEKKHTITLRSMPLFAPPPAEGPYLKFWGTRGSNPVAGMEYVKFGGNTPSLEVHSGKDLVIIDAGSGIRALGQDLSTQHGVELNILISHTHWDHLLGFPFFLPLYQSKRKVNIFAPIGFEKDTKTLFTDMLAYAYFPVALHDIQSDLRFEDIRDSQTLTFGSIRIHTHYAFHPGATLCFIIEIAGKKIGYVTDNEFLFGCHQHPSEIEQEDKRFLPYASFIAFLQQCDILIHEAQYTPEEYLTREGWGHSSVYNACALIKKANIKHWIVIHHDPKHTDAILLEKEKLHVQTLQEIHHPCTLQFGFDGMVFPI